MHPILVKTPFFTFYSYGLFTAVALALALYLAARRSGRYGFSSGDASDLLFIAFTGGLVGARLFYVAEHWGVFSEHPMEILRIDQGGLVWYGGLFLGGILAAVLCIRRKQSMLAWTDFFAPIILLAHAVGRIGCFMNGCCAGRDGHPVQLYESAGLALLSIILFRVSAKKRGIGVLTAFYFLGYGILRFGLEFLREGQPFWGIWTPPQWISAALIATSFTLFLRTRNR